MFLCVLMSVNQFTSYVVTALCQLLINGYVMLCYVMQNISLQSTGIFCYISQYGNVFITTSGLSTDFSLLLDIGYFLGTWAGVQTANLFSFSGRSSYCCILLMASRAVEYTRPLQVTGNKQMTVKLGKRCSHAETCR